MTVTWKSGSRGNSLKRMPVVSLWFEERDYAALQRIVNDPKAMPLSFEDWKKNAELFERNWKRNGHLVTRVVVDPDLFLRYCAARSKDPSGNMLKDFGYAWIEAGKSL
ncbi:hypothetical protein NKH17_12625 [Mesorhizobium sp. M1334]|uniref:hypothetical protein n=1 Tax=Mesorhizobium sp. M1334 TaxID=2957084 RepID=UPI00333AB4E2